MSFGNGSIIVDGGRQQTKGERVKLKRFVAALLAALVIPVGAGTAATSPQLTSYLRATQPHVEKFIQLEAKAIKIATRGLLLNDSALVGLPPVLAEMRKSADRLAKVKTPADVRGLNTTLVKSIRQEATAFQAFANAIAADNGNAGLERFNAAGEPIMKLQRHWRDEMIAKLRRRGLTVPLWVKKVGA